MAPTETLAEQHFAHAAGAPARRARPRRAAHRLDAGRAAQRHPRQARQRRARADRRHPRADRAGGRVRRLAVVVVDEQHRFGVRQRAALDAKAPRRAAPARAAHDRDADPAHAGADRLRRPRRHRPARAAARPPADHDAPGQRAAASATAPTSASARSCGPAARRTSSARSWTSPRPASRRARPRPSTSALRTGELEDFSVGLLHGQMPPKEKQAAMAAFAAGDADVLVATTVIEVGIDVPNATVMLVEDAERYGISQLHQLRGRIGRGEHDSVCLLFGPKESRAAEGAGRAPRRLQARRDRPRAARRGRARRARGSAGLRPSASRGCPRTPSCSTAPAPTPRRCSRTTRSSRRPSTRCSPTRSCPRARRGGGRDHRRVRIVAGQWGGRRLQAPPGRGTRPTADRVREALFSVLGDLDGLRVLDLFAGSGALGLEALSRGAAQRDVRRARRGRAARVARQRRGARRRGRDPAPRRARRSSPTRPRGARHYDLVLLDPPYQQAGRLSERLGEALGPVLAPGARVVARERSPRTARLDAARSSSSAATATP